MTQRGRFEGLARAGYAARGIVYFLLGALALGSAFGRGGGEASSQGALSSLLSQPFGRVALGLIAIGLIGHVLWRLAQSLLDADRLGKDAKGLAGRAGHLVSGLTHATLALFAAQLALGLGASSSSGSEDHWTAWLMQQPFGRWLVGLVGLVIIAAGGVQIYRAVTAKYRERIALPAHSGEWLQKLCSFGLGARGALFMVIGGFFLLAALTVNPNQAGSLPEAMEWVQQLPFGGILYVLAALGLVAFGIYSLVEARYRRIEAPDPAHLQRGLGLS